MAIHVLADMAAVVVVVVVVAKTISNLMAKRNRIFLKPLSLRDLKQLADGALDSKQKFPTDNYKVFYSSLKNCASVRKKMGMSYKIEKPNYRDYSQLRF